MAITRDGEALPASVIGSELPIDPGEHEVVARAAGFKPWSTRVNVAGEGTTVRVSIPALEPEPAAPAPAQASTEAPPTAETPAQAPPRRTLAIAGIATAGVGVVGLGLGTYFGLTAQSKWHQASRSGSTCLDTACPALTQQASNDATLSTVFFVAGGVLAAAGVTLWVIAPSGKTTEHAELRPAVGPGMAGLELGGHSEMKRASLLAAVLALTGCGDLLGIEVLSFDGGEESGPGSDAGDGSVPDAPKSDGFAADAPQTGDGPESSDGPSPTDSKSNDSPSSDGPGNDGPGNDGGCAAGTSGCTGNTPWSCVNGKVVDGAACSNQACVSGGCVGVCAPGQTQCTAGDGAFQTCQSDGTWSTTATCSGPIGGSPTCDPTAGCGAGTCSSSSLPDLCGNSCVNVTNDGYNCGLCGQTCTGSTCSGGYCTVQSMCDGSSIGGNAVNTGNASRLALETLAGVGGPYPNAYFGVGGSVYDCQVPSAAPSPPPVPTVTLAQTGGVCSQYFNDVVNDKSQAYVFDSHGGDCHGASLELVPSGTDVSGALFGTLESDVANTSALYALVSPALDLVTFTTSAGTTTTSSTTCITVSGTLGMVPQGAASSRQSTRLRTSSAAPPCRGARAPRRSDSPAE